ncbi:MAG TPA: universal stress protein [Kofleriaceae bacterium]|nr:universal stress protein [Kofleriaceae bacterium]
MVAFDFSSHGRVVLDRAVALASRAPFHVLHFVTAIDPHGGVAAVPRHGAVDFRYADEVRAAMLADIGSALQASPVASELHFFVHARIGKPADEILQLAREIGADLILVGTHGRTGLAQLVLGSVAERVVREAECPVLVARPKTYPHVELARVIEVERQKPIHSRMHVFSFNNNSVIMRPPEWPIS